MISLKNVFYKTGSGIPILQNINLEIKQGEFVLITGKSGSGKSTLGSVINGLIPHYYGGVFSGNAILDGKDTREMSLFDIGKTAGTVFQEPRSRFFMTDTFNEVALACTAMQLPREEIIKRIEKTFIKFNIENLKHKSIFNLSSGEKQKIAIASCCATAPKILIFDEPSANLDIKSIFELKEIIKELKREGKTLIVLEHRLFYLTDLFDRMIYLNNGSIVKTFNNEQAKKLTDADCLKMRLRSFSLNTLLTRSKEKEEREIFQKNITNLPDLPYFEIRKISFSRGKRNRKTEILSGISLKAQSGEIIGIIGENGAGKTTLAKLCAGLLKEESGSVLLRGKTLPAKKRLGKIYFVMQDSDYQLFACSVYEELCIGKSNKEITSAEKERILSYLELTEYKEKHPASLSRGQKQRLTVAGALLSNCPVLFFDEPTSGLDMGCMELISNSMIKLADENKIIFVISHDYEFLLSVCKRVIHISNGTVKQDFQLTENSKLQLWNILSGGQFE